MSDGFGCVKLEAAKALKLAEEGDNVHPDLVKSIIRVNRLLEDHDRYLDKMASPVSEEIADIVEFTNSHDWRKFAEENSTDRFHHKMQTGSQEGQVLRMLVSMSKATRVLEIGMFTGCGALAMAEALPTNGTVVTCEFEPTLEPLVRKFVDKSPHGKKIQIKIGPALDTMKALSEEGQQFDFVFIDADKSNNINYFNYVLDSNLLAPGGTICCDNALWDGNAYLPREERDSRRRSVHEVPEFNHSVAKDDRVYQVVMPVRDGIMLIRRKQDVDLDTSS